MNGKRDSELLRLYVDDRSEDAFTELVGRYAGLVYATCLRETRQPALAEDAAQGVFLLLSQKAARLTGYDTLAGWLYTAARYLSRNLMKQETRRRKLEADVQFHTSHVAEEANPLWEQIEPRLNDAMNHLKPGDREAILLRFVQELSLAEVGACLGLTENTARMGINRALTKIRIHLAGSGIALSAAALTLLLEERAAQAAPTGILETLLRPASTNATLSESVRQVGRKLSLQPLIKVVSVVAAFVILLAGVTFYRQTLPQRLNPDEQRRLYTALVGTWKGTIEFVDDQDKRHYTYPTTVTFETRDQSRTLIFTSRYEGSSNVDETTFEGIDSGQIRVRNGGDQSSHRLSGEGELVLLPKGGYAFQGQNTGLDMQIRIRISLPNPPANQLTIQEEYLPGASTNYQFRNRFTLKR